MVKGEGARCVEEKKGLDAYCFVQVILRERALNSATNATTNRRLRCNPHLLWPIMRNNISAAAHFDDANDGIAEMATILEKVLMVLRGSWQTLSHSAETCKVWE
jgi:hypothetical protein